MQGQACKEERVVYTAFGAYVQRLHFSVFQHVQNELMFVFCQVF